MMEAVVFVVVFTNTDVLKNTAALHTRVRRVWFFFQQAFLFWFYSI